MLESKTISEAYPELGEKLVGKFGNSKGWRRNRLRTASGFTLDAVGLDTASRGGKLEDQRPDFIVVDDIDDSEDSPKVTRKLIRIITKGLLPAGSDDLAILAIQNLIHPNGVFARLVNGQADYLRRRQLSGPIPALAGFAYEQNEDGTYAITSGNPTWSGFDVDRCEDMLNEDPKHSGRNASMRSVGSRVRCGAEIRSTATEWRIIRIFAERLWRLIPPVVTARTTMSKASWWSASAWTGWPMSSRI
jgi:hypothetical protein